MVTLTDTSVVELKGVGASMASTLSKLNIHTVYDLLFHLPFRYEDRTRIYSVAECRPFTHVSVQGEVMSADIQYGKKRMLVVKLSDGTGTITLRFFHLQYFVTNSFVDVPTLHEQHIQCWPQP